MCHNTDREIFYMLQHHPDSSFYQLTLVLIDMVNRNCMDYPTCAQKEIPKVCKQGSVPRKNMDGT